LQNRKIKVQFTRYKFYMGHPSKRTIENHAKQISCIEKSIAKI